MTDPQNTTLTRRNLLAGAGMIGAGLVAAACGSSPSTISGGAASGQAGPAAGRSAGSKPAAKAPNATPAPRAKAAPSPQDVQIAQLAAGLEVLAVGTYKAALDAATANKLGAVPPAVAEFVTVAMQHHQAHLDAWNKVLTSNGAAAVTTPNATLKPTVDKALGDVKDIGGAAKLALMLEQIAAATYLSAQGILTDKDAIKLAGSIQVVDAQHVSVLLFVLGQYPVPDTFAKVDMSATSGSGSSPSAPTGAMPPTK